MKEAILVGMVMAALIWPAAAGQHGLCFVVDFYVSKYGPQIAYDLARANGWKIGDQNAAAVCLRQQELPYRSRVKRSA